MSETCRMPGSKMQHNIGRFASNRQIISLAGLASIVVVCLVAYIPAMRAEFVWDDDGMLTRNLVLKENGLYRSWFTTDQANYWPLTWTSYWLEHQLWGLNPTGYHVVNVLVHVACALLIWRILLRLKVPGAWLAAFIFAVHPVNVESVAWITQRKNILSMFFFLLALLWYLRFDDSGRRRLYRLAVVSFVLAMLSKGAVAPLPVVILMCAWWQHSTISRRDVLRSLPFFAVSALMSVVEIWFQYTQAIGAEVVREASFFARLAGAGQAVWFYLYKALLPVNLSFVYPRWDIDPANWLCYIPDLALLGLLGLCWRCRRSWGRPLMFALGYYVVMLLPVLGFLNIYFMRYSLVADHYQYVSIIGIIALVVAVGYRTAARLGGWGKGIAKIAAVFVLTTLGILTWYQCHIYRDMETLWRDTLRKNPDAWMAHTNLGNVLSAQGKFDEAISNYRQALQIKPDDAKPHYNLGKALQSQGKLDEAIRHYHQALQLKPNYAEAHNNLGAALQLQGKLDEAISHYRQALRIKPNHASAHNNLGNALIGTGQLDEALRHFQEAIRLKPEWPSPLNAIAWLLATHPDPKLRDVGRAIELAEQAAELTKYQDASTLEMLAMAYASAGRFDRAVTTAETALKLASAVQNDELAYRIRKQLELYRQNVNENHI